MANDPSKNGPLSDLVKAESMMQVAIALPAACLIGFFLGDFLDHHYHQHWIALLGLALGAVGGFIQLISTAMRLMKRGG